MTYPQGTPYGHYARPVPGPPRTNSTAVAALICGVVGLFTGLVGFVAIVLGHIARSQIKRTGEDGAGIALAGLILGYVSVVLLFVVIAVFFWIAVLFVNA
ncbi:DUF4190 domain-containing protein [Rhodococcoides fascians]|uniref:DUF4190 domain-containing protein n=1 Tax=Rhodococcoides fascians TaxID=1828 RepID=UPI0005633DB1|nr:DUF4190 domain-containing protein [Rhodococcus fascians]